MNINLLIFAKCTYNTKSCNKTIFIIMTLYFKTAAIKFTDSNRHRAQAYTRNIFINLNRYMRQRQLYSAHALPSGDAE